MLAKSVVGLFCEDIRAEKNGVFSLVGIMPDNANVPAPPTADQRGIIPKLCLYIRVNCDAAEDVKNISTKLRLPDGTELDLGSIAPNIIQLAFEGARAKANPLAIVVLRAEFPAFPVTALGRMVAEVAVDDEIFVAAQLNLMSEPEQQDVPQVEDVRHFSQLIQTGGATSTTS